MAEKKTKKFISADSGNETAAPEKKERRVKEICKRSEMKDAIAKMHPQNQSRNKQIVTELIRFKAFPLLTMLYRIKNR